MACPSPPQTALAPSVFLYLIAVTVEDAGEGAITPPPLPSLLAGVPPACVGATSGVLTSRS